MSENNYYYHKYGLRLCSSSQYTKLTSINNAKSGMIGPCWYDILANPAYVQDLSYLDATLQQRDEFIVSARQNSIEI